jgi:hypothetical protein
MKVQILRRTTITGQPVLPGEVHEVSDCDGRFLIGARKADLVEELTAPEELQLAAPSAPGKRTRKPRISEAA